MTESWQQNPRSSDRYKRLHYHISPCNETIVYLLQFVQRAVNAWAALRRTGITKQHLNEFNLGGRIHNEIRSDQCEVSDVKSPLFAKVHVLQRRHKKQEGAGD